MNLTNHAWIFLAFGRKTQFVGTFSKHLLRKLLKIHYFTIFFKNINKPCINFSRALTKNTNFWEILRKFWNFLMKILYKNGIFYIYIYIFIRKFVSKIRAFGNNSIFLRQFFRFRGGGFPPFPPWLGRWPPLMGKLLEGQRQRHPWMLHSLTWWTSTVDNKNVVCLTWSKWHCSNHRINDRDIQGFARAR